MWSFKCGIVVWESHSEDECYENLKAHRLNGCTQFHIVHDDGIPCPVEVKDQVKAEAINHSAQLNHLVEFHPGEGWLCSVCDDDYFTFQWNENNALYFRNGKDFK